MPCAGQNDELRTELEKKYGGKCRLFATGYTTRVSEYMDAADVLISKPGGLSSTEAAVKEIALVHMSPLPGWEEENVRFFVKHGLSLSGRDAAGNAAAAVKLLFKRSGARAYAFMPAAGDKQICRAGYNRIYNYTLKKHCAAAIKAAVLLCLNLIDNIAALFRRLFYTMKSMHMVMYTRVMCMYIELYALDNLLMDMLVLRMAAALVGRPCSLRRTAAFGAIGCAYAIAALSLPALWSFGAKVTLGLVLALFIRPQNITPICGKRRGGADKRVACGRGSICAGRR